MADLASGQFVKDLQANSKTRSMAQMILFVWHQFLARKVFRSAFLNRQAGVNDMPSDRRLNNVAGNLRTRRRQPAGQFLELRVR